MVLDKNIFNIRSISYTNLIFAFLPISFILGNFIINLNLILLCILGIFHLKSKILTTKLDFTLKIIFLLFIVVFFSTSLSFIKSIYFDGYEQNNLTRLIKSVFFFRFYIFLLIIYLLSEYNLINFKYFFLSAALSSFLISVDVIFQYSFGFNIIGLESYGLELMERVPIIPPTNPENKRYLEVKKDKLGHFIDGFPLTDG